MLSKSTILKASAFVVAIATVLFIAACGSSTSPKKSWEQQFNDEVSSMDVNLGPTQESPAFEFHMNERPPHFSMILCKGASDDSRVQEDSWNTFFNEVRKYGPAESYKPDFSDAGEEDGKPIKRVMMFVNLKDGADASVAQDVGHKMVNVMKEFSPCK